MRTRPLYLGLDLGGTSVKAVWADPQGNITARFQVPTTTPDETLNAVINAAISARNEGIVILGLGVSAFGPIDRDPASPTYGVVQDTPKAGWSGTDIRGEFIQALGVPVDLDTDVNGALLAEAEWGAAKGLKNAAYVTIGTGVGGGLLCGGHLMGAPGHPELGHIHIARLPEERDVFAGICPFHGDCIEGLVSAPALTARWGAAPHTLSDDHPAWRVAAHDLAQLCLSLTYIARPDRIILGGGVSQRPGLIDQVAAQFAGLTADYAVHSAAIPATEYIVRPALDQDAGALGGIQIAVDRQKAKSPP